MAEKAQSAISSSSGKPARAQSPRRALTMLMIKGDPATTLKDLVLPPGATVAIVSSDPKAMKSLRNNAEGRFGAIRKVQGEAVQLEPPSNHRVETLDRTAFEPDARSQALLEGIRIAQADLHQAGGAYTSTRSGPCCTAFRARPSTSASRREASSPYRDRATGAAIRRCSSIATERWSMGICA